MTLLRAMLYHLFASGNRPRRSFRVRVVMLIIALLLLGSLSYRFAPSGYVAGVSLRTTHAVVLLYTATYLLVTLLFVLLDGQHKTFIRRLAIAHYLPLAESKIRALYATAYLPLCLLIVATIAPGLIRAFAGVLDPHMFWLVLSGSLLVAIGYNILLRIAISRWAQLLSTIGLLIAGALSWSLLAHAERGWLVVVAINFVVTHVVISLRLLLEPVSQPLAADDHRVGEHRPFTLMAALRIRAFRTRHYRATNMVILIVFGLLVLLAWFNPQAMPFDAVAVVTLLLVGTIGQEARSLSNRLYPLELMQYAVFIKWLSATWRLALSNILLYTVAVVVSAAAWFPQSLSVSYIYVLCVGLCLAAVGITTGSLITPQRSDVLMQLAAAGLYAALAWTIFKLLAITEGIVLPLATVGVLAISLATSYGIERRRWFLTIRGKHGLTVRTNA